MHFERGENLAILTNDTVSPLAAPEFSACPDFRSRTAHLEAAESPTIYQRQKSRLFKDL